MGDPGGVSPAQAPHSPHPERNRFRPDIEGLRAVAVLAVVLFHAEVPGLGGGFVGVDVFFVISGFLITGVLWREANSTGRVGLRRFYGARARRLLPASALVGVITMIASAALLPPLQLQSVVGDGIASALYVSNMWFLMRGVDYFASHVPPSPFQHYWSLGVEEQFYLVWPALILGTALVIRLVRRRSRTQATSSTRPYLIVLVLITTISFVLSFAATYVAPPAAFFSLPTRAWQLGVGGVLALSAPRWQRLRPPAAAVIGWTGVALIVAACTQLSTTTLYPGTAALLPTLGAALVISAGCATPTGGCGRLLATAPMGAIGRISYSWYLWHWPVLVLLPALLGHHLGPPARLGATLASAILAVATLKLLENPLRYAPVIRRSAAASLGLGAAVTATAVCLGVALLKIMPPPLGHGSPATPMTITATPPPAGSPIEDYTQAVERAFAQAHTAVTASADLTAVPSNLDPPLADAAAERSAYSFNGCVRDFFQDGQPECAMGDVTSPTRVALIGDSHAAMFFPAFHQLATQRHWRVETLAKAGCPSVDVEVTNPFRGLAQHFQRCEQWRGQILSRLRAERPTLVVVSVWRQYGSGSAANWSPGFTSYDPAWIDNLTRLVRQLRATGTRVLVLGPIPDPQSVVPACLAGHLDDVTACIPLRRAAVNQSGITAESEATRAGGGDYADLTELFCTAERCPVIIGNTLVYVDWSHVTLQYSRLLAPVIGALADRTLAHG